jgi:DNA-binding MarR family transcriptional regulator
MTSYRMLRHPNPEKYGITPVQQRWMETTRRALYDVELPWLDALATASHYIPDFLTPTPDHFETDIECDLFHLLHMPPQIVQKYLSDWEDYCSFSTERHVSEWGDFAADPAHLLPLLIDEIRLYWQRAIEPHWPALLSVIEGDILFRARQLALDGTDKLLNDISPTAKFDGKALRLDKNSHHKKDTYFVLDHEGLHLVPTVFADKLMWQVASDYKPMILYGARGTGAWQQSQPELDESLELLLGAGRASVLAELVHMPATTTELAHHLHLTAGAVSQHLSLLQRAGLVNPQRSGKRVYYQLSPKGTDLLRLFR